MKFIVGETYTLTGDEPYWQNGEPVSQMLTSINFPTKAEFRGTDEDGDLEFVVPGWGVLYLAPDAGAEAEAEFDPVDKPEHYTKGMPEGVEVIDVIRSQGWESNFYLANAAKYLLRCEHKGSKRQDLEKMMQFVQWELDRLIDLVAAGD